MAGDEVLCSVAGWFFDLLFTFQALLRKTIPVDFNMVEVDEAKN